MQLLRPTGNAWHFLAEGFIHFDCFYFGCLNLHGENGMLVLWSLFGAKF